MGSVFRRTRRIRGRVVKEKRYTIKYKGLDGRWVTKRAYTDKQASQALLAQCEKTVARREVGLTDRYAEHTKMPLSTHLEEFCATMRARGLTEDYVDKLRSRLTVAFSVMGVAYPGDLSTQGVEAFVLQLKKNGSAPATINHYIDALRTFSKWGLRRERWPVDAVGAVKKLKVEHDLRRRRRALALQELEKLVWTARTRAHDAYVRNHPNASTEKRRQLAHQGHSRALAYQLAALAGLRFSEVKTLAWGDIDLGNSPATITIRAANAKSRREDTVPVCDALAKELRAWREVTTRKVGRPPSPDEPVVHVGSRFRDSFKKDCEAAAIEVEDGLGRHVDMHALRHTYATMLARANVHPKVAQSLLRHRDIRMTLSIYTHADAAAQVRALEALPTLSHPSEAGGSS